MSGVMMVHTISSTNVVCRPPTLLFRCNRWRLLCRFLTLGHRRCCCCCSLIILTAPLIIFSCIIPSTFPPLFPALFLLLLLLLLVQQVVLHRDTLDLHLGCSQEALLLLVGHKHNLPCGGLDRKALGSTARHSTAEHGTAWHNSGATAGQHGSARH
jgi:hypothetical protein